MKVRLLVVCVALLISPVPGVAQATNAAAQSDLIQRLTARLEQLERRVAELEREKAPTPSLQPAPAAAAATQMIHDGAPLGTQADSPALKIAGFSDFVFGATDQKGTRSGFTEGQFILHLNSALSSKVSFLGELSVAARTDAGTGMTPAPGFNAEVERSIIRFEHDDHFKVSFGRYHTPINYWNTEYHHGQWLQTTIGRPEMIQFGGRLLPVHFVGALLEGRADAGGLNLNYNFGVGNGRGSVISRGGDAGDSNNHRAWLANVFVKPDSMYGLQFGGSVYRDKVSSLPGRDFREWISTAHVVWNRENPEIIGEFANVHHKDLSGVSPVANSQAFYVQAAYRLPSQARLWKPYYRFEYIHVPRSAALLEQAPSLAGSILGLRYDLSNFAALKFEYRNQRRASGQPRINGGFVQTSFTF